MFGSMTASEESVFECFLITFNLFSDQNTVFSIQMAANAMLTFRFIDLHSTTILTFSLQSKKLEPACQVTMAPLDPALLSPQAIASYLDKIQTKSMQQGACRVWQGPLGGQTYPKMRVRVPGHGYPQYRVHQIVLTLNRQVVLNTPNHEVSHLCHDKKCVEVTHLEYEPKVVNVQRNSCVTEGHCLGHGPHQNCLL